MLKNLPRIARQMGSRYVLFRIGYELRKRTGVLQRSFPLNFAPAPAPSLSSWRREKPPFFLGAKYQTTVAKRPDPTLKAWYERFQNGEFQFFNYAWMQIGRDYDWLTNPTTGYRYSLAHWTTIPDLDPVRGDVKYIWEKSRFSYILTLIRYDHHFEQDQSELIFSEIENWIKANPLNRGPNYICSQEVSLRLFNWIFALYYYQDSEALTQVRWADIMQSIYGQLKHVRANINFSRIAVRNNHAVTETLMLYVGGLLFPWFPEAAEWRKNGKKWFEEEVAYQVYPDGTYLQHSHNYQRVLTQLLNYAFAIAGANGVSFDPIVRQRAHLNLNYLYNCMDLQNGKLPNYGSNDGALFFPLATQSYRDYRPQLNAAGVLLNGALCVPDGDAEEAEWLGYRKPVAPVTMTSLDQKATRVAEHKGIYTHRTGSTFAFINCGSYRDRPFHADNLHLDLWINHVNILRDSGTYRYNTDADKLNFFTGVAGHNTAGLGEKNQMQKAGRFIWLHWSERIRAEFEGDDHGFSFIGEIAAFKHLAKGIRHIRQVTYDAKAGVWEIVDELVHDTNLPVVQHWNLHPDWERYVTISAHDDQGRALVGNSTHSWFSGHYGELSPAPHLIFVTPRKKIHTTISRIDLKE